jgi:hypothetical protein
MAGLQKIASMLLSFAVALCLGGAVLLAGCSGQDDAAVEKEIGRFRDNMAADQLELIYASASEELRSATRRRALAANLEIVNIRLGQVRSAMKLSIRKLSRGDDVYYTAVYQTTFAKGVGEETFQFKMEKGRPALTNYSVQSPVLAGTATR